mgnify:CR=1 FL=1
MKLRIREIRKEYNYTQHKLAEYLNCHQSLYSKYENGEIRIPLKLVIKIADFYDTSIDYLFGLTDEKKRH